MRAERMVDGGLLIEASCQSNSEKLTKSDRVSESLKTLQLCGSASTDSTLRLGDQAVVALLSSSCLFVGVLWPVTVVNHLS